MTFKPRLFPCLVLCLVLVLGLSAAAEEPDFLPDGSGDILLIHDRNPDSIARQSIEKLVTAGAAMRRVVDYGTPEQCRDVLNQYEYIICYDVGSHDEAFEAALAQYSAYRMDIGGSLMHEAGTARNGLLRYRFPTGEEYETIVSWNDSGVRTSDGYTSGSIQSGSITIPFCCEIDGVRCVPVRDLTQTLAFSALIQEITNWMWPYNDRPTSYAQFLVMDSVYPFTPSEQVMDAVNRMEQTGVPYVISVMPLSTNNDYPAMTQFCQVLAYAQSKGAAIILHAPIIHKTVDNVEELYEKLTDMTTPYINNGVYPLGIEAPRSWLNEEPYLTLLGRYRTVFVYDDGKESRFDLDAHTSRIARQGHQLVFPLLPLDQAGISQLDCYSSATYADFGTEQEQLLRYAQAGKTGSNPFVDLRDYNHTVWLDTCGLSYQDHSVYLDGKLMDATFHPTEYDTEFDFHRSPLVRMSIDLQNQNRVLMCVVVVLLIIFISFIAYARFRMRKRFFSSASGSKEE